METVQKKGAIINFLNTQEKRRDWRYLTSDSMSNKNILGNKTIYWLGIIELDSIDEQQYEYPIHFVSLHCELQEDREYTRDADGAQRGIMTVLYNLTELLPVLIVAQGMRSKYFHILIEEQVHANGSLTAHALISKEKDGVNILSGAGFHSPEPWIEMKSYYTHYLSYMDISDLRRIRIRSARSYNWQK